MAINIGPRIGIEGEAEYRKQMQNIIQQAKTLSAEMKSLTSSFDGERKSLKQNQEQRKLLNEQIKVQKQRVQELEQMTLQSALATDKNGERTLELTNKTEKWKEATANATAELHKLELELKRLPSDLKLVGERMEEIGRKWQSVGSTLQSAGRTMSRYVTAPLVGALTQSVKFGADFDYQMSSVSAVMQASEDEMAALSEAAIRWGEQTVYTATQSGEALYYMGLAGWDAQESIASLGGVLNLAAAGSLDLGRTSDIVTDAMTAMHYSATESVNGIKAADHFSNVLAQTMSNTNTTVDLLGEAFQYVAPVAGTMGYNIEDLGIALGLMANNGIKGTKAGTALRNVLTNMAKPSEEMQIAIDELGISLDDGKGNMLSLLDVMKDLRSGFGNMVIPMQEAQQMFAELDAQLEAGEISEAEYESRLESLIETTYGAEGAEKARYAAMLAGKRGMAGLLSIINTSDEEFNKLVETIYSSDEAFDGLGAAAGIAQKQMDNLKGDFTRLTSALGTSQIEISNIAKGPLREFVKSLTDLVTRFNALSDEQQSQIVKWALMAAAIGPVLLIVGGLVKSIGNLMVGMGTTMKFIADAPTKFARLTKTLSSAGSSIAGLVSGIGTFVVAHAGMIAALLAVIAVGYLVYKHWDDLKAMAVATRDAISQSFEQMKVSISNTFDNIKNKISEIITAITNTFDTFKNSAIEKFNALKNGISNAINSAVDVVRRAIDRIKSIMNFNWSLPKLKLPHFSISGGFSLYPPSVPKIRVDWYKKAMQGGMILNSPTIFGAKNGRLLGGGEAGAEVVVGANSLYGMIKSAVNSSANTGDIVINVYGAQGQSERELVDEIERRLVAKMQERKAVFG